ncbi:MAG: hypothetical protein CSA07_03805 [Bacteroidia bacterium]|nr:MAG: hypothetical protein CSA07_03805 [Bacteroidia bacterium]
MHNPKRNSKMRKPNMDLLFAAWARLAMRWRWVILPLFLGLVLMAGHFATRLRTDSRFENYFMEDDPMIARTREFKEIFGSDIFVAVLLECDDVYRPENLRLIRALSHELADSLTHAERVVSLTQLELPSLQHGMPTVRPLVPEPLGDSPTLGDSIRRAYQSRPGLRNRLVSDDGRQAWVFVQLGEFPEFDETGLSTQIIIGRQLHDVISQEKYAALHPLGAGLPYIDYEKNEFYSREVPRIMGFAILVALLVLLLVTRSLRGVLIPVASSIIGNLLLFGTLGLTDYRPDPLLIAIPLVSAFAIPLAYNIHVYSFFRQRFFATGLRKRSVEETMGEVLWPVFISVSTTVVALLTFLFTPIAPLHFVGFGAAISVGGAFLSLAILFPTLMGLGADRSPSPTHRDGTGRWDLLMARLAAWALAHPRPILAVSIPLLLLMLVGATQIQVSFDLQRTIGTRVPYVANLLHVGESPLGSVYSYDLLIDLKDSGRARQPESIARLDTLATEIERMALTQRTSSMAHIIKDLHAALRGPEAYTVPERPEELASFFRFYRMAGDTGPNGWIDPSGRYLRLMVEVSHFDSGTNEQELARAQTLAEDLFPGADVQVVGSLPQFVSMMQYVTRSQVLTFFLSLLLITLILTAVFGSVKVGLVSMIPNLAPAVVIAGIMGYTGMPLDMFLATIIPMVLGISVDDTVQILSLARREFRQTGDYHLAMERTFRVAGRAVVFSTMIICSNFILFCTSKSSNIVYVGFLSVAGLMVALLADLLITPLILKRFNLLGKPSSPTE